MQQWLYSVLNKKFNHNFFSLISIFITEKAKSAFFPAWTQQISTRSKILLLLFHMGLQQQKKQFCLYINIYISFFRSRRWNLYRPSLIHEYFTWTEEHTFDLSDLMERRSLKWVSKFDYTSFISLSWWRENISLINHQSNFTQTV